MNFKQKYIDFCKQYDTEENCKNVIIPLFMQPWYLDIVCKNNWDAMAFYKNNEPIALMPYSIYKQAFFTSIRPCAFMPYQAFVLGEKIVNLKNQKPINTHRLYHLENEISEYFASAIDKMKINACFLPLHPDFFCATPFIQHRFTASVKYTYKLNITNTEFFNSFSPVLRKKLRKAEKELYINNEFDDLTKIYSILKTTYTRQKQNIPYSFEIFSLLVTEAIKKKQGKMFVCQDNQGNICSVLFIAWDKTTAYSLIGGTNYNNTQRDAGAFIQYESIKYANKIGLTTYDFEGSVLKGVEEFFQHFGATRTPFIVLEKYYSTIYRYLRALKHN